MFVRFACGPTSYAGSVALTAVGLALAGAPPLQAQWRGELSVRGQAFGNEISAPDVSAQEAALTLSGSWRHTWDQGRQTLVVAPFVRWDPTGERTRVDFRDLSWAYLWDRWEVRLGVGERFWGVTESLHLVDVINQREPIVGAQRYVKLGQPLAAVATRQPWGALEVILMPAFRERPFAGRAGLLWSSAPVSDERAEPQSGFTWRPDAALRWSRAIGTLDVGVSGFLGTNREPRFTSETGAGGTAVLIPHYDRVAQLGVDLQLTTGSWLWKLEAVTLDPEPGRYLAAVGGLEYAFADYLSVFAEYAFDSRGSDATTSFADDFFAAARLLMHDGEVRAGAFIDRRSLNTMPSIQIKRRLGAASVLALEAGGFIGRRSREPWQARRQHDYLSLTLTRYF